MRRRKAGPRAKFFFHLTELIVRVEKLELETKTSFHRKRVVGPRIRRSRIGGGIIDNLLHKRCSNVHVGPARGAGGASASALARASNPRS